MKKIRVTHPVFGLIVTAMIGMGCANAHATARRIVPGERVGRVRLGMSDAELEQRMGKAATRWADTWSYPDAGMKVFLSGDQPRKVTAIVGTTDGNHFDWKMAGGIGMGSTAEEIVRTLGRPGVDRIDPKTNWRSLSYQNLGIDFGLSDGKVVWLAVRK